ncbi:MAG: bifunctional nuclease family protein [Thermoanaerobaculia bacterium]
MTDEPAREVRMEVRGLMLDPGSNMPIVVLRDPERELFLPIWIGVFEANAIAMRMEGVEPPRPMTHDLLDAAIRSLGAEVEKVLISDLRENTFYAVLHLRMGEREVALDARPSDALALALRTEAPIFVLESVLEAADAVELLRKDEDADRLRKWLENVDPDDLGKYTM